MLRRSTLSKNSTASITFPPQFPRGSYLRPKICVPRCETTRSMATASLVANRSPSSWMSITSLITSVLQSPPADGAKNDFYRHVGKSLLGNFELPAAMYRVMMPDIRFPVALSRKILGIPVLVRVAIGAHCASTLCFNHHAAPPVQTAGSPGFCTIPCCRILSALRYAQ